MNWTQLRVTCRSAQLDDVVAVMSMLDHRLMIEDYSDIETGLNTIYGDLIDESILKADKTHAKVSMYIDERHNYNDYLLFFLFYFVGKPPCESSSLSSASSEPVA